ncbi:MAG: hypothetical protein QM739_21295 [Propionivibrio sp.]
MSKKKTFAQLEAELARTKAKLAKWKRRAIREANRNLYIRFSGSIEIEVDIQRATLAENRWDALEEDSRARLLYKLVRDEFMAKARDDSTRDTFMGSARCESVDNDDGEPLDFEDISRMSLDRLEELGVLDD